MRKSTLAIILMLGVVAEQSSAITTTLEYEDQREAASRSAISNEIAAAIAELPPSEPPGNYAAVSNAAMNAAQNATNLVAAATNGIPRITESSIGPGVALEAENAIYAIYANDAERARTADSADMANAAMVLRGPHADSARPADDIFAQLDAATVANAQQSASLASLSPIPGQVSTLSTQVATIGAYLNAEDARFVVTNCNSVTHTPEAYVEIKLPDESWSRVWSEKTQWNNFLGLAWDWSTWGGFHAWATNVTAELSHKADRAWGFYDSTTGAYAPDGYTWISSEKIAIAANLAYQRTVTTEGAIWVLESNGVVTETGGMTNGFFRISDDEGNSLFEIVKGNKRTVGADASSCLIVAGFTPTKLQIGYSIVSDVHPTLYVCESLTTQNWKAETDSDCIANVTWSGGSGAYVVQVQGKSAYSALYVKATYEVGGETYISNAAPVSMQYMMINGVKYAVGTATISGNTVLTLTVAP